MLSADKVNEIFCIADDFCKEYDVNIEKNSLRADGKKHRRRKGQMSDSEIMTILICFHFNTYRNFKHYYLCYVKGYLKDSFPKAVSYNRFVELESHVAVQMALFLELFCFGECTGISFIDSTPLRVCRRQRILQHKTFKGLAQLGKCSMGWFYGFKLHLICNEKGETINFTFTPGNVDDREPLKCDSFIEEIYGKLVGDRGYISKELFCRLFINGIQLITKLKNKMKSSLMSVSDKVLLRKRSIIESINDELKNMAQIEHSRHRSFHNFVNNFIAGLAAYSYFPKKPMLNLERSIDKQLVLW